MTLSAQASDRASKGPHGNFSDLSEPAILLWVILLWLDAMVQLFAGAYGGLGLRRRICLASLTCYKEKM